MLFVLSMSGDNWVTIQRELVASLVACQCFDYLVSEGVVSRIHRNSRNLPQ